ncbi:unnamed protein product [Sphenostylis stenocarpa]|uniref:Uncharacterized protein n=1 Tax=Sphenostylis stenocarpa TaxID=92480 RepID=A0AA86VWW7_9FABA|nr:unnamed protein product [Sphenostylis stenocarpa]
MVSESNIDQYENHLTIIKQREEVLYIIELIMRLSLALFPLLFALLLTVTIEARKDTGEYWKMIMKDQQMPEGLQGLLSFQLENNPMTQEQLAKDSNHDCEDPIATNAQVTLEKKVFTKDLDTKVTKINDKSHVNTDFESKPSVSKYGDFEPRPSVTKYDDFEPRPSITKYDDFEPRPSITKYGDFEPRPSVTKYGDFEPRPSVTKYGDFEPRPSLTKYGDFEPRPSVTKYGDFEPRPSVTKYGDFEPRPSATKYGDFEPRPSATKYNN